MAFPWPCAAAIDANRESDQRGYPSAATYIVSLSHQWPVVGEPTRASPKPSPDTDCV